MRNPKFICCKIRSIIDIATINVIASPSGFGTTKGSGSYEEGCQQKIEKGV